MGSNQLDQVLLRIFDDEEFETVRARVECQQRAQGETLFPETVSGTESCPKRTIERIPSSQGSADLIHKVESMSQEESDALDDEILTEYLTAKGVDVPAALARFTVLINEHFDGTDTTDNPGMDAREHHGVFARIQSVLNQALSSTAWTAFTRPAVLASVVTGVLVVGIGVYGLSPLQQDGLNNATTPVRLTQSIPSDRLALAMVAGETNYPGEWGAGQSAIPSVTADSQITVPVMLTEARGMDTMSLVKTAAANSATVDTVEREFVFVKGDTLWHGMRKHGVPEALQAKLTKKINVVFHPGDRVVFNFVDGEFNGLEILLGNQAKITITKGLSLVATHISRTDIQTVVGTVKHSLHGALARKLNDQAAWRVATRMKHLGVPVNTLQSGAQFEVRIERRTVPGGEVVGYGEIKYLRLDAGKQGTFFFDSERLGVANQPKVLS